MVYRYYKTVETKHGWTHGRRFFKVDDEDTKILQVCLSPGDKKKGRGNMYGIFLVSRSTLFSNYLGMEYAVEYLKADFDLAFEVCIAHMKQQHKV